MNLTCFKLFIRLKNLVTVNTKGVKIKIIIILSKRLNILCCIELILLHIYQIDKLQEGRFVIIQWTSSQLRTRFSIRANPNSPPCL